MASTLTPSPKVAASGIAGSVGTVLVWILGIYGIDVPPEVAAAFVAVIGVIAGYFTPPVSGAGSGR